jgi:hypothetical protein
MEDLLSVAGGDGEEIHAFAHEESFVDINLIQIE